MKKILTLCLALVLCLGMAANASAVDVKVKGQWDFTFGWADNLTFYDRDNGGSTDAFQATQRIRTQVDFIANEYLSGVLMFEIGNIAWGRSGTNAGRSTGGALDADGVNIETKRAYLDWMVPGTDLAIRMGIQGLALPMATFSNPVFADDAAGILASYKINNTVSVNAFWVRGFDQWGDDGRKGAGTAADPYWNANNNQLSDETDIFGIIVPLTFDGFKITPWTTYGFIGGTSGFWDYRASNQSRYVATAANSYDGTARAWHVGLAFELNMFDPFTFKSDIIYGDLHGHGDAHWGSTYGAGYGGHDNPGSRGWFIDALAEYKFDWGKLGLFGWWSSGDSAGDVKNGKFGRLPVYAADSGYNPTSFGYDGSTAGVSQDTIVSKTGVGLWSIGFHLKDVSFVDKLSHTLRFMYSQGTNDSDIIARNLGFINPNRAGAGSLVGVPNFGEMVYLTDKDRAYEINFDHTYQMYENLAVILELSWIHLDLDKVWDHNRTARNTLYGDNTSDAWKAQVSFKYTF